jgi:mannose-1-phosphate guanylyltransferase
MVNVAFNHHKIEQYFGDGHRWGVQIGYAYEGVREHGEIVPKPFGSAGGMRRIQDFSGFFDDTTLVLCGDALIDLDIGAALHEHKSKGAIASVVALDVPLADVQNYGIVVADESGQIQSFQEKPKPAEARSTLASTGIYIFEPEVLDLVPPGTRCTTLARNCFRNWWNKTAVFCAETILQLDRHRPGQRLLGGACSGCCAVKSRR